MRDRRLPHHTLTVSRCQPKIRRKRGAGMPVVYDATLATARARRGGIFLPRAARIFLRGPPRSA